MSRYSLMVIDDNEIDRYLFQRQIQKTGLDAVIFEELDGKTALAFFRDHESNRQRYPDDFPPTILFLDINMPLVNGWEFLAEFATMRQALNIKRSVVILFTTSDQGSDREQAARYDFVADYLVKGEYSAEQLAEVIQRVAP